MYWCGTIWFDDPYEGWEVITDLREHGAIESVEVGVLQHTSFSKPHRHIYVITKRRVYARPIFNDIIENHWIKPLTTKVPGQTRAMAEASWRRYIQQTDQEREDLESVSGVSTLSETEQPATKKKKITKTEEIVKKIKNGARWSQLLADGHQHQLVMKLMCLRPPRQQRTNCLYIYGKAGIGKTRAIYDCMKKMKEITNGQLDYFCKGSGLSKFWDGYDNQPVVFVDDPAHPKDEILNEDQINALLTVLSCGPVFIEVKHSNMVFDSNLVIIASNMQPKQLAKMAGETSYPAVIRRLEETCGAYHIKNKMQARSVDLRLLICRCILKANHFDIPDSLEDFIRGWEAEEEVDFTDERERFHNITERINVQAALDFGRTADVSPPAQPNNTPEIVRICDTPPDEDEELNRIWDEMDNNEYNSHSRNFRP